MKCMLLFFILFFTSACLSTTTKIRKKSWQNDKSTQKHTPEASQLEAASPGDFIFIYSKPFRRNYGLKYHMNEYCDSNKSFIIFPAGYTICVKK